MSEASNGLPIGVATDAASVSEVLLGPAALARLLVIVTVMGVPVLGSILISPHRKNRVAEPTNDGRRMRRYRRRWKVEQTIAWLPSADSSDSLFERT